MIIQKMHCLVLVGVLTQVLDLGSARTLGGGSRLRNRSSEHKSPFCAAVHCKGLIDQDLKICYQLYCTEDSSRGHDFTSCILDLCDQDEGLMRQLCIFDKCHKKSKEPDHDSAASAMFDKPDLDMQSSDWSDAPVAEEYVDVLKDIDDIWYPEFEKSVYDDDHVNEREEETKDNNNDEIKCKELCHSEAVKGKKAYESCITLMCHPSVSHQEVGSVSKRWSTRMCMESHCKAANNKVQYFLCGKQNCHK